MITPLARMLRLQLMIRASMTVFAVVMVHGPAYEVSTVPAGTPVLSGPGQPPVGLGEGVVGGGVGLGDGVGASVVVLGAGVGLTVGEGVGEPVGLGVGELVGLGHFGFGTHVGRMPTA
jgi:hypothetical protein